MRKLTNKMKSFAEEYVKNGYNGAKAYRTAYGQDNVKICATEAHKMLRDKRIVDAIETTEGSFRVLGQMEGLDKKAIVRIILDMAYADKEDKSGNQVPDYSARKDAITLYAKLTGDFKEKKELKITNDDDLTDVDPTKISDEEKERLEKDILADL